MERMTYWCDDGMGGGEYRVNENGAEHSGHSIDRLAAYEDTGLTPEQVKDAIRIAERIATANYPHNLQRERSDIVAYMRWITDVMRDAKTWWNGRIASRAETEATLKQEVEEE